MDHTNAQIAIKTIVDTRDILLLKDLITKHKSPYVNMDGTTKFVSEYGLYCLIMKNNKKIPNKIINWIVSDLVVVARKTGIEKANNDLEKEVLRLKMKLVKLQNDISVFDR